MLNDEQHQNAGALLLVLQVQVQVQQHPLERHHSVLLAPGYFLLGEKNSCLATPPSSPTNIGTAAGT